MAGNLQYDIVLLTEDKYVLPEKLDAYKSNILVEDALLRAALEKHDLKVTRKSWTDPEFDWSSTKYIIVRTIWDYFEKFDRFLEWFHRVKSLTTFINAADTIIWNLDKHYLADLQQKNIPVVETYFVEPGSRVTLKEIYQQLGWEHIIIKPAVSGAARHTYQLHADDIAAHEMIFQQLIEKECMLVQPFQKNIIGIGEYTLMVMDGKYTHAVLKQAKKGDFRVQDDFGGSVVAWEPDATTIALAESIIRKIEPMPVYGRVDLILDNNNILAVSELEIIEPELWFRTFPPAAQVLGDAIARLFN